MAEQSFLEQLLGISAQAGFGFSPDNVGRALSSEPIRNLAHTVGNVGFGGAQRAFLRDKPTAKPVTAPASRPTNSGEGTFYDRIGPNAQARANAQRDPFASIAEIQKQLSAAAGQVDADYQSKLAELRGLYQLAETPQEKAQLQFMLGHIEAQREAGHTVIRNAYQGAIADAGQRASQMRATGQQEAQAVGDLYRQAAADTSSSLAQHATVYDDAGVGVGAEPITGDATDFVGVLEAAAPREQALARNLANISADDVAFLGQAMAGEQTAQQGELERLALQLAAMANIGHQQRVGDRIAQERMALADNSMRLGSQFQQREWDLEDSAMQVALDLAEQRRQGGGNLFTEDQSRDLAVAKLVAEANGDPNTLSILARMFPQYNIQVPPVPELGG